MNKFLIYAVSLAFVVIAGLSFALHKERAERAVYEANQTALLADVEHYKAENGKNAASVQKLTLTNKELKQNYDEIVKAAEVMKIDLKRAQSISETATKSEVEIRTEVRDSIVYIEGEPINTQAFNWADPWVDVRGVIHNDSVNLHVASCDTLIQIVHKVPHKFLFFKWGCKAIKQDIMTSNPHTNIVYSKYIELR